MPWGVWTIEVRAPSGLGGRRMVGAATSIADATIAQRNLPLSVVSVKNGRFRRARGACVGSMRIGGWGGWKFKVKLLVSVQQFGLVYSGNLIGSKPG